MAIHCARNQGPLNVIWIGVEETLVGPQVVTVGGGPAMLVKTNLTSAQSPLEIITGVAEGLVPPIILGGNGP
jgi:hypothetical protein